VPCLKESGCKYVSEASVRDVLFHDQEPTGPSDIIEEFWL
jgi:hypothetical protein